MLGLPAVGAVDFGDLRRTAPISRKFGVDRGLPVDRFYIERFLEAEADSIRGQVLEIGEDTYTRRFGGQRVTGNDVLHVTGDNPAATIVADLADAPQVPDGRFDSNNDGIGDFRGLIDRRTVTSQLLYEMGDPARYVTPDCVAAFSSIQMRQDGDDR